MSKFNRVIALILTLCLLTLAVPVFAASESTAAEPKQISASVKMYSKAGSGSTLASLKSGDVVLAYSQSGKYTLVEKGGKTGYVETRRLKSVSSSAKSEGVAISNKAVALYTEASTDSKRVARANSGAVFAILVQGEDYLVLRNGTITGCAPVSDFNLYTSSSKAESYAIATKSASILSDTGKSAPKLTSASSGELLEVLKKINSTNSIVRKGSTVGVMSMKNTQAFSDAVGTVQLTSNANVYRGASTKLTKLGSLKKGALAQKLGTYGSYTVILFDGAAGCVATKNVKETAAAESSPSTGEITTSYVEAVGNISVYSSASKSSSVVGSLYDGSLVKYFGTTSDGAWAQISYSGNPAYVERSKIKASSYTENDIVTLSDYSTACQELIDLMNEYRKSAGVAPLKVSNPLMRAAEVRVQEITVQFSHIRPNGQNCNTVDPFNIFGENIAMGAAIPTAQAAAKGFMSSNAHRTNAMRDTFKTTGVGCVNVGGTLYWVQLFGY